MRWTTEGTNVQVDDLELWCCTITPGRTTKRLTSRRTSYVYGCRLKRRPAARWGRRIRRNSIRNCFHDDIIGLNLNIWWDRRGFVHIDYICWNFKFRWKNHVEKREELFSCPPRCPRNRHSILTVFNASKTDEESGFKKVPSLLRVRWLPQRTGKAQR